MITLDHISLRFPDGDATITALDNVSLAAHPGAVTAITGPSGSGKSSLLAVAATLIHPSEGRVTIDGIDATDLSRDEATTLRRERIGIVFQQPNLLPALTAVEQLCVMNALGRTNNPKSRRAVADDAAELLASVGLGDHLDKRPHQLSGGQRQRVNIARALMNDPSVLLVDEPTSALDQARGEQIIELILELTDRLNTATLLVTHDLVHLPQLHREVTLVDGRITTGVAT